MKWLICARVKPPVSAMALRQADFHATIEVSPILTIGMPAPAAQRTKATDPIIPHLHALGFRLSTQHDQATPSLPAPWRKLHATVEADHLNQARTAALACALRLAPQPPQSVRPDEICAELEKLSGLERRVREAVGFALIDLNAPWDYRNNRLSKWRQAVGEILHERGDPTTNPRGPSDLLQDGFALLTAISGLRGQRVTPQSLDKTWEEFTNRHPDPPIAFEMAFQAEATYRLTEQGDTEQAQDRLARLTALSEQLLALLPGSIEEDLRGGMWWHHLGRLAYYEGDFAEALDHFATEWRLHGALDNTRRARLRRNIAGVLTDLGYLGMAERLTRQAMDIQESSGEQERFKTWGRLGEILLRRGNLDEARGTVQQSLEIQEQSMDPVEGHTRVNLGHTALLAGQLETASTEYDQADTLDGRAGVEFNPYLWMGRAALNLRQGATEEIKTLWEVYGDELAQARGARTLPAAVIVIALHRTGGCDDELLRDFIHRLIDANYAIEALYPLPLAYPTPADAEPLLAKIEERIETWREAVDRFRRNTDLKDFVEDHAESPSPVNLLPALAQARRDNAWEALGPFRPGIFPMNLLPNP